MCVVRIYDLVDVKNRKGFIKFFRKVGLKANKIGQNKWVTKSKGLAEVKLTIINSNI